MDGNTTHWARQDGLAGNLVFTMCEDSTDRLWIGTYDGLNRFANGKFETFTTKDGLPHSVIWTLYRDRFDRLWAGTPKGLVRIKDGTFETFDHDNAGISHNDVRVISEDAQGRLWVGTSYGLNRWTDGRFTQFINWAPGRPLNVVLALHADDAGDLWIGTMEQGLFRLRHGAFVNFTREIGLHDNLIFQILEDDSGYLWLTCNRGIFRVRKAELNSLADGALQRVNCAVFGKPDGLPGTECNGSFQPAGWKSRDGRLWFPTTKGVAVVDPQNLPRNRLPPPVEIEEVRLNGMPAEQSRSLTLGPGIDNIEIRTPR